MKVRGGIVRAPPVMLDNIHERAVKEAASFWLAKTRQHLEMLEAKTAVDEEGASTGLKPPKLGPAAMEAIRNMANDLYYHAEMEDVAKFHDENDFQKDFGWSLVDFHDDVLPKLMNISSLEGLDLQMLMLARTLLFDAYNKYATTGLKSADKKLQDFLIPLVMRGLYKKKVPAPIEPNPSKEEMKVRSREQQQAMLEKYRKLEQFYADFGVKPKVAARRKWEETVNTAGLPSNYPLDIVNDGSFKSISVVLALSEAEKKYGGRWHGPSRTLEIVFPTAGDIPDEQTFKAYRAIMRTTIGHELQHMVQSIMQASLRLRRSREGSKTDPKYVAPPETGRRAGTPYGPRAVMPKNKGNAASKKAYPRANQDERYYLDPIEFFPQIHSWTEWFLERHGGKSKDAITDHWKAYVGLPAGAPIEPAMFFKVLKKHDKRLWKRAVAEGTKIVKSRTGWPGHYEGSPAKQALREKLKQHVDKKRAAVPASITLEHRGRTSMKLSSAAHRHNRSRRLDTLADRLAGVRMKASTRLALEEAASLLALLAMSMEKAKEVLGFPPGASPTPDEIKKAYRKKAMEFHPDRGGDPEKMKEVNVAVEVLEGTRRPDRTFDPTPPPSSYTPPPSRPYTPPTRKKVTLEDALAEHKGMLNDVAWLFRTDRQRAKGSYMGDESSYYDVGYVLFGKKPDGTLVFLALREVNKSEWDGGGYDIWTAKVRRVANPEKKATDPKFLNRAVQEALNIVGWDGKFNLKVYDTQGKDLKLKDLILGLHWRGSVRPVTVKQWLVNGGHIAADDPRVAGRKDVVDLLLKIENAYSREEKKTIVLIVNGVEKPLSESDSAKAVKAGVLRLVFGNYAYDGSKKNLNKAKFGKKVMRALAHAPSLDDGTKAILEKLGAEPAAPSAAA